MIDHEIRVKDDSERVEIFSEDSGIFLGAKMNTMIKRITLILVLLSLTFPAFALTLQQAKQQGLIGEQRNGYLGIVVKTPEAAKLVKLINTKRKELYVRMSRKHMKYLKQIQYLAGQKALKKTRPGHYIQNASGKFVKK